MELTYKNEKLRNLCENPKYNKELVTKYGIEVSKKLPRRIKELKSFNSLNDVPTNPPFRRHKLTGDRDNQFAISITNQYRLIFRQKENNIIIEDLKEITKDPDVLNIIALREFIKDHNTIGYFNYQETRKEETDGG